MIANEIKRQIASATKRYRLEREWTLEQMASATGLHASTIQKIENGTHVPRDLTLHKIRKHLPGFLAGIDAEQCAGSDPAN